MAMAPMDEDTLEESDEEIFGNDQEQENDFEADPEDDLIFDDEETEPAPSNEDSPSDL